MMMMTMDSSPKHKKLKINKESSGAQVDVTSPGKDKFAWKQLAKIRKRKRAEKMFEKLMQEEMGQSTTADGETEEKGRDYTVSIAVPGSILDNAQTKMLQTYLAGQIARAAVIFCVDEIIVFDDTGTTRSNTTCENPEEMFSLSKYRQSCLMMARILQYLECPQYLRKFLFPLHKHLEFAGVLNPVDSFHHLRENDESPYREGIVQAAMGPNGKGSYVKVGLQRDVLIDKEIKQGVRVTVKLLKSQNPETKKLKGVVVAPHAPRTEMGLYWGYNVRLAHSLGSIFSGCPFPGGYDLTIGTSDKGSLMDDVTFPRFKHLLIVFGGLQGIEASLEADERLEVEEPQLLFNHYLNTCPSQGCRAIRTEEAILVSLSALRPKIEASQKKHFD